MVKNKDPPTTVTGQKNKLKAISAIAKDEIAEINSKSLEIFLSKGTLQKPWRKRGKDRNKESTLFAQNDILSDKIASKMRKDVNNVSTKPTPLAARSKAIVLIAAIE